MLKCESKQRKHIYRTAALSLMRIINHYMHLF